MKIKIFDYLNNNKNTKKNRTEVEIGNTVSLFDSIGKSSAIDRSASNYKNAREKVQSLNN